jgi:MFS family permease
LEETQKSLAGTSLAHFINDGLGGVLPLMYPVLVTVYNLSVQTISILTSLQNAFSILVSPLIGRRSDATGEFPKMIAIGLGILAIGVAGYATSGLFFRGSGLTVILLPFTVLVGVGGSFYHPLGATVLRAKFRAGDLGRGMGINGSIGSAGRMVMPFAATILIAEFTLPSIGFLAGLSLWGALATLLILRHLKFENRRKGAQGSILGSLMPNWSLTRRLFPLTVVSFSRGIFTGVIPFVPLYLVQVDHFGALQAGFLYSGTLGVGIFSQLLFGFMEDRFGPRGSLAVSNLGGVIVLFLFALSTNPFLAISSLILFGLFSYSALPLLLGLVHTLTEFQEMTSAGAIVWGIGMTGGSAIAPLLIGVLALPLLFGTLTAGFLGAAAIGIVSIVLMPFIRTQNNS